MEKRRKCARRRRQHGPGHRISYAPTLTQGHAAWHSLFSHCVLYPPVDMAQYASERSSTFPVLIPIAHFVLSFCCSLPGPELPVFKTLLRTYLLSSAVGENKTQTMREEERLGERDPGPLILYTTSHHPLLHL